MDHTSGNKDNSVEVGKSFTYAIIIKMPPLSASRLVITVTAQNDQLSICYLTMAESGTNFPCSTKTDMAANYSMRNDEYSTYEAVIDLGVITNVGKSLFFKICY